jgi:glucose/arabinose dehydrogenase
LLAGLASVSFLPETFFARAQSDGPVMLVPNLAMRTAAGGLVTPISIAFIGPSDMLVLEKNTGRVKRVVNGVVQATALDLAVNNASERGLLGIALMKAAPARAGRGGRSSGAIRRKEPALQ